MQTRRHSIRGHQTACVTLVLYTEQSFRSNYHVIRYRVSNCLRQSSRDHALSYATCEGCTEKYFEAGSYCHVAAGRAKPVGSSLILEKLALAVRGVLEAGKRFEYRWSKMKVSASSRTMSMVVMVARRQPVEPGSR
jgi:hypothetical protein